jgi:hypothetical protein
MIPDHDLIIKLQQLREVVSCSFDLLWRMVSRVSSDSSKLRHHLASFSSSEDSLLLLLDHSRGDFSMMMMGRVRGFRVLMI